MVSFVIYFHSSRIENLKQTLRLLAVNEPCLASAEVLLICQDRCQLECPFEDTHQINLEWDSYQKPRMCNLGVSIAKHPKIVLLDSDRVLPDSYFTRQSESLAEGTFVSTRPLYSLCKPYSDEEILTGEVEKIGDFRSPENALLSKNLFAGNTLFFKADYEKCGGMDESFVGYGHADTDMTRNVLSHDMEQVLLEEDELHLFHAKTVSWNGEIVHDFQIMTAINAAKYLLKWRLRPCQKFSNLKNKVIGKLNDYPEDLSAQFIRLCECLEIPLFA